MKGGALRIGEVAQLAGVSADLVRYYERVGILPPAPRTAAGYRCYSQDTVSQLLVVRSALRFGFSAKELAGFVKRRDSGRPPCHAVRAAGQRLLAAMDQQLAQLRTARTLLEQTLAAWDDRLARTAPGEPAHLLKMLPALHGSGPRRPNVNRQRQRISRSSAD
jgi:DNA-binding transcriptional MerR regulator